MILYHAPRDHGPSTNRCFGAARACGETSICFYFSFIYIYMYIFYTISAHVYHLTLPGQILNLTPNENCFPPHHHIFTFEMSLDQGNAKLRMTLKTIRSRETLYTIPPKHFSGSNEKGWVGCAAGQRKRHSEMSKSFINEILTHELKIKRES